MKHLFCLLLLVLAACASKQQPTTVESDADDVALSYATNFRIRTADSVRVIEILNPETGKKEREIRVDKPFQRLITLSSTHIGMISELHSEDVIAGVSSATYVYNPIVQKGLKNGQVIELGEESNIPLERIIASKADIIIYSGFNKDFPHREQLEQLGIICLPDYDWREVHPLGKAEWIKVFGVLLGKEQAANDYFKGVEQEYLSLVETAKNLPWSECLLSGNIYGDFWYSPAGESYNAHLFRDAHISYPYAETTGTGSVSLTMEEVVRDNTNCRYWINPGATSLTQLLSINPKASHFRSFKEDQVYCYSQKGNYFWEMSAIQPQKVLSDLIRIAHPDAALSDKLYFYSRLSK